MQQVWLDGIDWDEQLVPSTLQRWQSFVQTYSHIGSIKIPRWINFSPDADIQFHGFCDASEKAYGAALYIRVKHNHQVNTHLLVAKTKVAPVKTVSLPRLELCGAVILAEMVDAFLSKLEVSNYQLFLWTDSTIVLAWLRKQPCTWTTFVANRITKIKEKIDTENWSHVDSQDNPADLASRGTDPQNLKDSTLWWHGPAWLKQDPSLWPSKEHQFDTTVECKPVQAHMACAENTDILSRFSSLPRALRVISHEVVNQNEGNLYPVSTSCEDSNKGIDNEHLPERMAGALVANEQQEAVALKKALEWELSLETRDLRSHAWFHGPLVRQRAEEIVVNEGDFLIRDCTSQPDNYVLTCRSKAAVLHFVINKILLQPKTVYERIQYQFEDEAFDTVPDLITYYVGSGKPISAASGARIKNPCNRTYPLSFYGHKIIGNQLHAQMLAGFRGGSALNSPLASNSSFRFNPSMPQQLQQQQPQQQQQQQQQQNSPMSSPPRVKRDTAPRLPSKKQRSQSLTPAQAMMVSNIQHNDGMFQSNEHVNGGCAINEGRRFSIQNIGVSSIDPNFHLNKEQFQTNKIHSNGFQTIARTNIGEVIDHFKFTTHSLPRSVTNVFRGNHSRISGLLRDSSLDSSFLSTSLECRAIPELPEKPPCPPPKPIRAPTLPRKERDISLELQQHSWHRAASYHASGSDSGNGSGDSMQSSIPGDLNDFSQHRGVIIKNPRFMTNSASSMTLKSLTEFDAAAVEEQLFTLEIPEFKMESKFDIENYSTLLLPSVDNKPLDGDALCTFKMMMLENGSKIISEHITRIDLGLLVEEHPDKENNILHCCGLELMTLPQGKIFRNDLVERTQCIKLLVAVTILTCQTDLDRAALLSKWIQVAIDTKTALGNLFGFSSIMLGLCMPQIQKLDQAWHILRQKFTDNAFIFESKLRPMLNSMNDCTNPQAPNTTIPHVLLYILLKDRPTIDILNTSNTSERSSLYSTCVTTWESKAEDFGLTINFNHLDSARNFLKNLELYRKNARMLLEDSNLHHDELLSDAFRTEFHIKFLWGSKCALATAEDRHSKLEKVLALMADKFCSVDNNGSTD